METNEIFSFHYTQEVFEVMCPNASQRYDKLTGSQSGIQVNVASLKTLGHYLDSSNWVSNGGFQCTPSFPVSWKLLLSSVTCALFMLSVGHSTSDTFWIINSCSIRKYLIFTAVWIFVNSLISAHGYAL